MKNITKMRLFLDKTWNHTILIVDLKESKISLERFCKEVKDNSILFLREGGEQGILISLYFSIPM